MSHFSQTIALFVFIGLIAMLAGCGTLTRNPVPPKLTAEARIPEMTEVRAWAGRVSLAMERDFAQSFEQESPEDFPRGADGVVRYAHLALSGGGANGAFGAGFLNGWSTTGSRPVFKIVTGVSTGAVMAPFAFLGPPYDAALHEFYTTTTTRDLFDIGSILSGKMSADDSIGCGVRCKPVRRVREAVSRATRRSGSRLCFGPQQMSWLRNPEIRVSLVTRWPTMSSY